MSSASNRMARDRWDLFLRLGPWGLTVPKKGGSLGKSMLLQANPSGPDTKLQGKPFSPLLKAVHCYFSVRSPQTFSDCRKPVGVSSQPVFHRAPSLHGLPVQFQSFHGVVDVPFIILRIGSGQIRHPSCCADSPKARSGKVTVIDVGPV